MSNTVFARAENCVKVKHERDFLPLTTENDVVILQEMVDRETDVSKFLLENTEHVPFKKMREVSDKWSKGDEIRPIVMSLTDPACDYLLGKNALVILRLVDLGHEGKKEWLVRGDLDSSDSDNVHLRAPRKVSPEILQTALMEVFDAPKALALMEKLENGEAVVVGVEPQSARDAYNKYMEKLQVHITG